MTTQSLIDKLWSFCDTLRDDGMSYGDYVEQLTYLLFLKMADEYGQKDRAIWLPEACIWESFRGKNGVDLKTHYEQVLKTLGADENTPLGQIFAKSQNRIQDPAKLSRLWKLMDAQEWTTVEGDVKGDIYEGLLQKNAEDVKSGAGQYFTSRPLIRAIVECVSPKPKKTIADPACGTGGFLLGAHEYLQGLPLKNGQNEFLRNKTFFGWEIVPNTARLCRMNLVLHGIGDLEAIPPISLKDSLLSKPTQEFDYILSNPPFGKKSTARLSTDSDEDIENLVYKRDDFWATTNNKQLNFLQHIYAMLKKPDGQAAVVVPDNVLFERGAGEKIRRRLLETCNLHTILRLPQGIFYANGVKANVLFFEAGLPESNSQTKEVWIYDYRTNIKHSLKNNSMKFSHLQDFIQCYNPSKPFKRKETWSSKNPDGRWRRFSKEEIFMRDRLSLDISWIKDDSFSTYDKSRSSKEISEEIMESLQKALDGFKRFTLELNRSEIR